MTSGRPAMVGALSALLLQCLAIGATEAVAIAVGGGPKREHDIALEVCPTSNVCTRSVPSLAEHPLPALVAAGVPVTINSDDPPMFSTTLNREYQVAADLLDLDEHGVAELARQAVRYSFLDEPGKSAVLDEIDAYVAHRAPAAI